MDIVFAPDTPADRFALAKAAGRGQLRRIIPGLYTSDLTRPLETLVREHLPALIAAGYPQAYLSHSTAAVLRPINGSAWISSGLATSRAIRFPGVAVHRAKPLPFPEIVTHDLEEMTARSLTAEPVPLRVRLTSPLQTVFELLRPTRGQPDKSLPRDTIYGLIAALSESDRLRASAFAERNGLRHEMLQLESMLGDMKKTRGFQISPPEALGFFFYNWRVGELSALPNGEYRFAYDSAWSIPISGLPLSDETVAYEGPGLPAFFDNMLPEGWTEARLQAVFKIARTDTFGLLRTTQKYLSNLTLRPRDFDESRIALDFLDTRLADIPEAGEPVLVEEAIQADPDSRDLWVELRRRGATRLSGIQPKLPVHLDLSAGSFRIGIGGLANTSTHILKLPSAEFPELVENEWTTMELARRVGLTVPAVLRVVFPAGSELRSPGLLIERFDLPDSLASPRRLPMIEEAASLLGIRRHEKYDLSMERIAASLLAAGIGEAGMVAFFDHVTFSWLVGNGDLHAKNIAVLRLIEPGMLGDSPREAETRYSPLYDLVNTTLVLPGDLFALPVNGKQNNLRAGDFAVLGRRWEWSRAHSIQRVDDLASRISAHLPSVLEASGLSADANRRYRETVEARIRAL